MFPPPQNVHLDIRALSGICGSISIACWVVVFSPQIIENFRRSSAEGLSVVFIVVWLLGDVFNILGAVLQGVLPTMIILAVYYTLADIVLLGQCFYYKGFTLSDAVEPSNGDVENTTSANGSHDTSGEATPLLRPPELEDSGLSSHQNAEFTRRNSHNSFVERHLGIVVSGEHLSPAVPFIPDPKPEELARPQPQESMLKGIILNTIIILLVCFAGVLGWWLSEMHNARQPHHKGPKHLEPEVLEFNVLGQVFGYICAVLYLGSRVPQLLLNWRRKSTEGISMLFFLFACIGNLTYVLSIFAYDPSIACHKPGKCRDGEDEAMYGRYILVNLSWLLGSFGTLLLDAAVFVQYFLYRKDDEDEGIGEDTEDVGRNREVEYD